MLQGVIFDLDGVIVDSHPAHLRSWRSFFESVGKEVSDTQLFFVLEGRRREDILRHFLGDLTADQVKHYGARKEALFRNLFAEVNVIAGIHGLLDDLRACGIPTAVASSGSRRRVEFTLQQLGLGPQFRVVLAAEDVAEGKPDPAVFNLAAQKLGVHPAQIVVCEDSVAGIRAARSAGMKCLGIAADSRQALLREAGADHVASDFRSIRVTELTSLFAAAAAH